MPFFGEKVSYSQKFTIDDTSGSFFVQPDLWKGSVAEVWVNGKKAGVMAWDPYILDISTMIQKGDNLIDVRITGSLKNTLGYHHVVQTGWIDSPFSWNQGPEKQPEGSAYQFLNYGLYNDFKVMVKR
jgi:hypothetical protein